MNECQKRGHRIIKMICEECGQEVNRATFKAPDEWISIKDRLPDTYERILCYSSKEGILTAINKDDVFGKAGVFFHSPGRLKFEDDKIKEVTHWRHLQEPPKQKKLSFTCEICSEPATIISLRFPKAVKRCFDCATEEPPK